MADSIPTDSATPGNTTTPQYLPGEMLNLIAEQVPQEVYVVVTRFTPYRNHRNFDSSDRDLSKVIGTFSTLELANRAGKAYVHQKVEPFIFGRDDEAIAQRLRAKTRQQVSRDRTTKWTVYARYDDSHTTVRTLRHTMRKSLWEKKDMPLPLHCHEEHGAKCPCCHTAEEIEAQEKVEAEVDERMYQRMKKRRRIEISKELEELKKDESLDTVDLDEQTEDEFDDSEMAANTDNEDGSEIDEENEDEDEA